MPSDWIDDEAQRRANGENRPLTQAQHDEMNTRYPGATLEYCFECGQPTGRAGKAADSRFKDDGRGPFCYPCYHEAEDAE